MLNNIVGIQYIGTKPSKTDNVANTGAVWTPRQVHNFSSAIAEKLLKHPSVFALAEISAEGATYMNDAPKASAPQKEPIAFVNINNMDSKALAAYARLNFNRTLDDKEKPEVLRTLVSKLMSNATLDEIQEELLEQERKASTREVEFIGLEVSQEEYALYQTGDLVLKLVPNYKGSDTPELEDDASKGESDTPTGQTDTPTGENQDFLTKLEQRTDAESEASREQLAETPAPNPAQPEPELSELLAKLEKPALLKLAKEQSIRVSNTMTADVLRGKLLEQK